MHNLMASNSNRFPGLNQCTHDWTLETVVTDPAWTKKSSAIDNEKTRSIVGDILKEFTCYVDENKHLPSGIVHCDLNSLNIIGEEEKGNSSFSKPSYSRTLKTNIALKYMLADG